MPGGRPKFKVTPEQRKTVEAMSGFGIPQDDIARHIGVAKKTLLKHFRKELDEGVVKANSAVAKSLWQNAVSGNVSAQIFWAKTRMRWRETSDLNVTGDLKITKIESVIVRPKDASR